MGAIEIRELARLSGYTAQRLRQLQADAVLPKSVSRGRLPRDESIAALFGHLRAKLEKYSESRAASQNREQSAKASLAELNLHERLGNLVETARLRFLISDLATTSRVEIQRAFPDDVARKICRILSEVRISKRADFFRATCPRCRIEIFDDLDKLDETLEEPYEKNRNKKTKRAKASQP